MIIHAGSRTRRSTVNLLLVEDNPGDARLVAEYLDDALGGDFTLAHAANLEVAISRLHDRHPDLVLLDLGLPDSSGLDGLRRIRSANGASPVVVLTGLDDQGVALDALEQGAQDYLVKDRLDPAILSRSIRYSIERHRTGRELRRTRETVESQRALNQSILRSLPEHIAVLDRDGTIISVNEAWTRFARENGGDPEGYEGENYLRAADASVDPYARRMAGGVREVLSGERERFTLEYPCHGPHTDRWFLASVAPLEGSAGGVVVSHVDVTDRIRAESELRDAEARWSTALETMTEAVLIMDRDGDITFANPASGRILGLEPSQVETRSYADAAWNFAWPDGEDFPEDALPFRRVMDTGAPVFEVELSVERGDGERVLLSVNAAPIGRSEGQPTGVVISFRDVTDRRRMEEDLRHRALHDNLTGLPNRTLLIDRLDQAVARTRRQGEALGLMILDLDRFKHINDSLGHTAGDRVLDAIARRLTNCVRDDDTVGRWGGDEFILVLPDVGDEEGIETIRERVTRALEEPFSIGGERLDMNMSIGAVLLCHCGCTPSIVTEEPEELVRFADTALIQAKQQGRGSFALYDPSAMANTGEILQREQDLRRGLERGEFEPFYQPVIRLDDGTLWGVEPLARWRHPERGLVAPDEFIVLAEETGLVGELSSSVLRQALEQLARWSREGLAPELRLTPNVSGRQFESERLVDDLRDALEASGMPPTRVHLEVTETSLMRAPKRIDELRNFGAQVWIDDFGTGYSSFLYLRDLDVDGLKIDMSFVQGLGRRNGSGAIIDSILTLGSEMGLQVIGEGIETREQLQRLRAMGCRLGQGYLLGRPVPASEMTDLLRKGGRIAIDSQGVLSLR